MWCVVLGVACFPCVLFVVLVADCLGECWLLVWAYACLEFCYLVFIWGENLLVSVVIVCLIEAVFGDWRLVLCCVGLFGFALGCYGCVA